MQNRGTMGNVVCVCGGVIHPFFLSWTPHKRTGQWVVSFFNMQGGTGNDLVLFILILVPLVFWGDFAYSCPIYSDPERESILVLSICKQLMMSEFGAEAHGSPGGHVFTGCLYSGESSAQEPHQASHETNRVRKYLLNSVCAVICASMLPVWPS